MERDIDLGKAWDKFLMNTTVKYKGCNAERLSGNRCRYYGREYSIEEWQALIDQGFERMAQGNWSPPLKK